MGRCHFTYRPRFYTFVPTANGGDAGAGNDYVGQQNFLPIDHDPAVASKDIRLNTGCRSFLGMSICATNVVNAGSARLYPTRYGDNSRTSGGVTDIDPAAGTHFAGLFRPGLFTAEVSSAAEGYTTTTHNITDANGFGVFFDAIAGGDDITGAAGVAIVSTPHWRAFTSGAAEEYDQAPGATHDTGPVAGGLTCFPIPAVDTHSLATIVREILVPMDMRVHGVTFMADTSDTGNGLRLQVRRNAVTTNITPVVTMTDTAFAAKQCLPTGGNAQFEAGATRDLLAGDTLVILKSGTNAMTHPQAFLVCTPKGHFNTDFRRDRDIGNSPGTAAQPDRNRPNSYSKHRAVSGPALGGIAYVPLGTFETAQSQAAVLQTTMPMPFSGEVLAFVASNRELCAGSGGGSGTPTTGHRLTLRNNTQAVNIVTTDDMYYYYQDAYSDGGFLIAAWNGTGESLPVIASADRSFDVGDSMQVIATTEAGETMDSAQAGIYVRVTGFPAHGPLLD